MLDGGTNDTSDVFNNMRAALGFQRATSLRADITLTVTQENVDSVFVDGRPVKRRAKLVGVDPDAIVRAAQAAANHLHQFLFP